jgi:hypothetical protein
MNTVAETRFTPLTIATAPDSFKAAGVKSNKFASEAGIPPKEPWVGAEGPSPPLRKPWFAQS